MSTAPRRTQLDVLAAEAAADPRKAKSGVTKLARPLAAGDLVPCFEDACRAFEAAGERELAVWAFSQARKVEKKHEYLRDVDRLHGTFLDFVPAGVVAPGALRDQVALMRDELDARVAFERFHEILEAAFDAGFVPYARVFPDLRTLAKAAGVKKRDAEDGLAVRLLRTGVLPGASHAIWNAAGEPLVRVANGDLLDLLLAAEPDTAAQDAEPAEEIRQMWLAALAEAGAGAHVPQEWFFTKARECAPEVLLALTGQAAERLFTAGGGGPAAPPPGPGPIAPMSELGSESPGWWRPDTDIDALAAPLDGDPEARRAFAVQLDAFARDLCYYANVDYRAALRRLWERPAIRRVLHGLVEEWLAGAASGLLPEMEHALYRLAPLAESGYADLEPGFAAELELADPLDALLRTLHGGIPEELGIPQYKHAQRKDRVNVLQDGEYLTIGFQHGWSQVFGPREPISMVGTTTQGLMNWHDGRTHYASRYREGRWETYHVVRPDERTVRLTLEEGTHSRAPRSPSEAKVTFPGAAAPSSVEYADGLLRLTAPDGTVTARLPFSPTQKQRGDGTLPVPPPGWWPRMTPVDPDGSAKLRTLERDAAAELLNDALTGQGISMEGAPALRTGVARTADAAAECLRRSIWLRDRLGLAHPETVPPPVRTRPDLPAGRTIGYVAPIRALAAVLEDAVAGPASARPLKRIDLPRMASALPITFGTLGGIALGASRALMRNEWNGGLSQMLCAWANTPWGDGSGRWRLLRFTALAPDEHGDHADPRKSPGELWRTPNGALLVLGYQAHPRKEATAVEYSPDGAFAPFDLPGWAPAHFPVLQGWGGADRVAELGRLITARGRADTDPSHALDLAERTGMATVDAAMICFGAHPPEGAAPELRALYRDPATGDRAKHRVAYPVQGAVCEKLMPDDPSDLWEGRLEIARAAARYEELKARV